ncbi:MAG: thiamine pyrophosphokinase [Pseudonocardia sp.]|nr:thiamine pyrophosphokinase [Pseudonocardia sp.]
MRMSGLMSPATRARRRGLPGLSGVARVDRNTESLVRRLRAGEIAVLDEIDLDQVTADALVCAQVAAVVNAAPSISGRYPNLGPQALLAAGVPLVDGVGADVMREVHDGAKLRLHDGCVFLGERLIGRGVPQTAESVVTAMAAAREGLSTQLEAFCANMIEFVRHERELLLDGVGVPDVRVRLEGRHVLVVAGGLDHEDDLARLRRYIRECQPVLVGVAAGADALAAAGYRPDLVVGDPTEVSHRVLASGVEVVVPAFADGHAPGLYRAQDLGASAVAFPSSANPEDLALLLAHHHGASLIVIVGFHATLTEFLDRGRLSGNASMFLTQLKVGGLLVDAKAAAALYRNPMPLGMVVLLVCAVMVAMTAALMVSAAGPAILGYLGRAAVSLPDLGIRWS